MTSPSDIYSQQSQVTGKLREARRSLIAVRREELGIIVDEANPLRFAAGGSTGWTCVSLQQAADTFDVLAISTSDPVMFMAYAYAASEFQTAHDAQGC